MGKALSEQPRVVFKQLKGFQAIDEQGKVKTILFLNASREVVAIIDSFGKLFKPVVYDMNGNIEKLWQIYVQNEIDYMFLDDMLKSSEERIQNCARDALTWLKRALEMIEKFFSNVVADHTCEENLKRHIEAAYAITLKQYHSWIIQKSFSLIYTVLPNRSQLIGKGDVHHENVQALEKFLDSMRMHLNEVNLMICN
ncbi:glycolipid transfer protein B [Sitodiplosis mosellana]|uniref:glycolipid transfer protein B n=1 Tax=Sitodiplosis mosellana TaxID=263140 RepID=UPI002443C31B|nr:glycolipid transfer protein B [Sitodiplosis mosellana]XP_055303449.1 glycolipid transfer protein B [Sitodiplosis mosellana]XP_055303450.1 glycolipid transfer protein B [Sitodiplosis mosellana]XP_055303451.1 glycolipid transfer protein B [Sitodiplosis mosellana]